MKKMYKVPLYEVKYDGFNLGKLAYVDDVIVKKSIFGVKEVETEFDGIDIICQSFLKNERLDFISRKPAKAEEMGHHLVLFAESLKPENEAKLKDLVEYMDGFETSEWKRVFDSIRILTKEEKKQLRKKVNSYY